MWVKISLPLISVDQLGFLRQHFQSQPGRQQPGLSANQARQAFKDTMPSTRMWSPRCWASASSSCRTMAFCWARASSLCAVPEINSRCSCSSRVISSVCSPRVLPQSGDSVPADDHLMDFCLTSRFVLQQFPAHRNQAVGDGFRIDLNLPAAMASLMAATFSASNGGRCGSPAQPPPSGWPAD